MTDDVDAKKCHFCDLPHTDERPLISGKGGLICPSCISLAHQITENWGRPKDGSGTLKPPPVPRKIKERLDQFIIGQDEAKEVLSVAVYNHYKRLSADSRPRVVSLDENEQVEVDKSNVLLLGPSGTGKTLLARTLAKIAGVPFVIVDATSLTQAGYVGDDVETIIERLVEAADGNIGLAEWGIVYIDEADKLARRGASSHGTRDVSGEGVQQALLKIVEGAEVKVSSKAGRRQSQNEKDLTVDTRNILFIAGGAFDGLGKMLAERSRLEKTQIGFHAEVLSKDEEETNVNFNQVKPADLKTFGLIPEFIGRFPIIAGLNGLAVEDLIRILTEPRNALVKQYQHLFAYEGVELIFEEEALHEIAQKALEMDTGARSLRGILEGILKKPMFELPSMEDIQRCLISLEAVEDPDAIEYISGDKPTAQSNEEETEAAERQAPIQERG